MRYEFVIQHINALGGTERSACAVMNGLAKTGASVGLVELFSQGPSTFALEPSISVASLFSNHVKIFNSWFRIVWKLARHLKRVGADVLVIVEATHALYGVAAARLAGVRCVMWEHFNFNVTLDRRKRVWGRQIAARWADDIVVLTQRDIALWKAGTRVRAHLTAIPNIAPPVPENTFDMRENIVLAAGRLMEQKGYDLLLEAWAIVMRDARSKGWSLLIRGDGDDRGALQLQAQALENITIAPATGGIVSDYRRAGVFVCSSRYEGLPMVLLEASAYGLPIVSFDCETGPAEIIVQGVSGLLVPPLDVKALADGLLSLMSDSERRGRMAEAARLRALDFQSDPVIARWERLLDKAGSATLGACEPS